MGRRDLAGRFGREDHRDLAGRSDLGDHYGWVGHCVTGRDLEEEACWEKVGRENAAAAGEYKGKIAVGRAEMHR